MIDTQIQVTIKTGTGWKVSVRTPGGGPEDETTTFPMDETYGSNTDGKCASTANADTIRVQIFQNGFKKAGYLVRCKRCRDV
jgi:hypothetical protein